MWCVMMANQPSAPESSLVVRTRIMLGHPPPTLSRSASSRRLTAEDEGGQREHRRVAPFRANFHLKASTLSKKTVVMKGVMKGRNDGLLKVAMLMVLYDKINGRLCRSPRKPLLALYEDSLDGKPDLREAALMGSTMVLVSIETEGKHSPQVLQEGLCIHRG